MIFVQLVFRSVSFVLASKCFDLFEVTFLFNFFSLSLKPVFSTKLSISASFAKFACLNVAAKLPEVNLLNFCVVIYYDHDQ